MKKCRFLRGVMAGCLALMVATTAMAVPAKRGWQTMTQPDGTTIQVEQRGDEFYHYWVNEAEQEVRQNDNGFWEVVGSEPTGSQVAARRAASPMMKRMAPHKVGAGNPLNKGLVILVQYTDKTFTTSTENLVAMISGENYTTGGATGSVREYFYDQSNGQYNPQFDVIGPVTLSNNRAYYGGNKSNGDDQRPGEMVNEACSLANSNFNVDFTKYDNDKDGTVDFVYIIYAGGGEADGGPANSIWPHSWDLNSAGISASSRRYDGKYILKYACSCERIGGDAGTTTTIGTFCHEFSHVIGMPDYYDTSDGEDNDGSTPGKWTLMDQGNYNNNGMTPPNYSTFDKYYMGWLTPENLGSSARNVTLQPIGHKNGDEFDAQGYQLNSAGSLAAYNNTGVQYYVENRQQSKWDQSCPGHGLLIWKVMYNQTAWNDNGPNATSGTIRYAVVSASGKTAINYGTGADPFPGTKKKTSWTAVSGREIINITENTTQKTVSFTYIEDPACHNVVLNATNCTINPSADCVPNGTAVTATITPKDASYDITSVTITRGSTNITSSCTISQDKQSVTIPGAQVSGAVSDNITITASATQNRWLYTLLGEHVVNEEASGAVTKGGQLQLAIVPLAGYIISSGDHISIEMGGAELTWGSDYTYADGTLTINSVTGDVNIYVFPELDPDNNYTFIPLTNTAQIVSGAKMIIVGVKATGGSGVQNVTTYLAGPLSGTYMTAVTEGYTIDGEAILVPKTSSSILVFDIAGTTNNWTLTTGGNQLRAAADAVYVGGSTGTNTWKIGVNSLQTTTNYTMYFNGGSPRFRTYSNAQAELQIYITQAGGGELPTPVITFEKSTNLTCRDGEVFENIASSTYGTVTYNSSDPTNAPVDASGTVRPTATGSYTITASVAATSYYKAAQAQYTLVVTAMPTYAITWIAKGSNFANTNVRQGDGLVLPDTDPAACDNGKVFMGWSTESAYTNATVAPTYAKNGDAVAAATTYYAIYAVQGSGSSGTSVASQANPFTGISGNLGDNDNIHYEATQGNAGTAPIVASSGDLRIYQDGGLLTLTAKSGITITGVSITTTTETYIQYKSKGGSYSADNHIAEGGTFAQDGFSTDELTIKCTAVDKYTRLNINYLAVSYTGGAGGTSYTQFSTGCGDVEHDKTNPAWTLADGDQVVFVGSTYTNTVNDLEDGLILTYSSSDETVASVASNGQVTALKAGNTTITVSTAGTDDYYTKALSYNVSVVKNVDAAVVFSVPELAKTMTIGARETEAVAKAGDNAGTVVYSSSKPNVASVDAATGEVSALTPGVARITARVMATTKYEEAQASYDVTVEMGAYNHIVTWKANEQTYLVQYYKTEDALTLPAEVPTCDGKTFQGWTVTRYYLDPFNAPSDMFTTAGEKTVTENVTYYAVFK